MQKAGIHFLRCCCDILRSRCLNEGLKAKFNLPKKIYIFGLYYTHETLNILRCVRIKLVLKPLLKTMG